MIKPDQLALNRNPRLGLRVCLQSLPELRPGLVLSKHHRPYPSVSAESTCPYHSWVNLALWEITDTLHTYTHTRLPQTFVSTGIYALDYCPPKNAAIFIVAKKKPPPLFPLHTSTARNCIDSFFLLFVFFSYRAPCEVIVNIHTLPKLQICIFNLSVDISQKTYRPVLNGPNLEDLHNEWSKINSSFKLHYISNLMT